ncbi:cointegrate resolution protein s [Moniliophthora roreri MCA 2997]|uniref:Cointegrate resolution protein s n=1 Tax=Moniliophthora roreri (strain MCA 2997) TaxID=1381753 RepID=V2XRU4_MONRO|nr:cointegrate resolution protein s [Moniliophthora roreri MCA 2997]
MHLCDDTNLDGTKKSPDKLRSSYSHAEKLHAAYRFGYKQHGLMDTWQESEVTRKMLGNLMTSPIVSKYMSSLKCHKVQSGETPTSSQALTKEDIHLLYNFTRRQEYKLVSRSIPSKLQKNPDHDNWSGYCLFCQLQFIYVISFICLLWIDEALKIQAKDIDILYDKHSLLLTLTLPFRKTHQFSNIKPFHLQEFLEELKHICPVRAYMEWVSVSNIEEGYLCQRVQANDMVQGIEPMSSQQFLVHFHNHLSVIGLDAMQYGGHSFRHGGCQWLHIECRWPLQKICEWGGWSQEFSNLTIVKYLISWNDNPRFKWENFFLMNQKAEVACVMCGRKCLCYGSVPAKL